MSYMGQVIDKYEEYLRERGRSEGHIKTTGYRLRTWFGETATALSFEPHHLKIIYKQRTKKVAVATHRNELNQVKSFWRWCVKKGIVKHSPAEDIEPIGKPNRGKDQLTRPQAKRFFRVAHRLAKDGDAGAVAALMTLELGMRNSEIRTRRSVDVVADEDGVWLWIKRGKTPASSRVYKVDGELAGYLVGIAAGLKPEDLMFSNRTSYKKGQPRSSNWLIESVRRICKLAGVPYVCPHGLRGTKGTLEAEADAPESSIARQLGHASVEVTRRHYLRGGAGQGSRKVLRVLEGGKK
jgi:integrase